MGGFETRPYMLRGDTLVVSLSNHPAQDDPSTGLRVSGGRFANRPYISSACP